MKSSGSKRKAAAAGGLLEGFALYPYQKRWVEDDSQFKIAAKSRQIGFTYGTALRHALRRAERGGLTLWISGGQRQSTEAIEHVSHWTRVLKLVGEIEETPIDAETKKTEVRFERGGRIVALPANPDTIRGYSGDVVLDEFAFHRSAEAIWRSAFATITRGFNLEVISTPAGRLGRYYDLARAAGLVEPTDERKQAGCWMEGIWSAHWCDVQAAVRQGFPVDPEKLRVGVGDDFTWRQEYCCEFMSDAESLIPLEQVVALEDPACAAVELGPDGQFNPAWLLAEKPGLDNIIYLGGDLGRRRDRTVLWAWSRNPLDNLLYTRGAVSLRAWPFSRQREAIDALMPFVQRACIDSSGLGLQMTEELQQKWGAKVEPVVFTMTVKEDLAMRMLRFFSERGGRIPYATWVRGGMVAVKRVVTPAGNIRFDAARTEEGHADAFWAAGLGLHAAQGPSLSTELLTAGRLNAGAWMLGGLGERGGLARALRGGF